MGFLRLADTNPESSVRQIEMTETMVRGTKEDVWYAGNAPDFRFLSKEELPDGVIYGMKHKTVVLTRTKFVIWLCERLQARGIKFKRTRVYSLADLKGLGHDILINASGIRAENLKDVMEATNGGCRGPSHLRPPLHPPRRERILLDGLFSARWHRIRRRRPRRDRSRPLYIRGTAEEGIYPVDAAYS